MVDLGGMICAPTLALQTDTIIDQEDATTMHSLNDGLGDGRSALDRTDAGNSFQQAS